MMTLFRKKNSPFHRVVLILTLFSFVSGLVLPPQAVQANILSLPAPGSLVTVSEAFTPAILKGLTIHPENPLQFDFIIDKGDEIPDVDTGLKPVSTKLIKYFLASLTTPEEDLWVNLSPYEKDRITADGFGHTEMGRDLLAQDYLLKQLTASIIHPENEKGREFWDRVHKQAYEKYGLTNVPVDAFNKVWITPKESVVVEHEGTAYVAKAELTVQLEEDFHLMDVGVGPRAYPKSLGHPRGGAPTEIFREIILPEIEKEVNQGKNFAQLRQIYHSMILAAWYKERLKTSLLSKVYADQNKTKGIDVDDPHIKQKIYDKYIEAFKKGVFNYIKEDIDPVTEEIIPRKYFSGGFSLRPNRFKTFKAMVFSMLILIGAAGIDGLSAEDQDFVRMNVPEQTKNHLVMTTNLEENQDNAMINNDSMVHDLDNGDLIVSSFIKENNQTLHQYLTKGGGLNAKWSFYEESNTVRSSIADIKFRYAAQKDEGMIIDDQRVHDLPNGDIIVSGYIGVQDETFHEYLFKSKDGRLTKKWYFTEPGNTVTSSVDSPEDIVKRYEASLIARWQKVLGKEIVNPNQWYSKDEKEGHMPLMQSFLRETFHALAHKNSLKQRMTIKTNTLLNEWDGDKQTHFIASRNRKTVTEQVMIQILKAAYYYDALADEDLELASENMEESNGEYLKDVYSLLIVFNDDETYGVPNERVRGFFELLAKKPTILAFYDAFMSLEPNANNAPIVDFIFDIPTLVNKEINKFREVTKGFAADSEGNRAKRKRAIVALRENIRAMLGLWSIMQLVFSDAGDSSMLGFHLEPNKQVLPGGSFLSSFFDNSKGPKGETTHWYYSAKGEFVWNFVEPGNTAFDNAEDIFKRKNFQGSEKVIQIANIQILDAGQWLSSEYSIGTEVTSHKLKNKDNFSIWIFEEKGNHVQDPAEEIIKRYEESQEDKSMFSSSDVNSRKLVETWKDHFGLSLDHPGKWYPPREISEDRQLLHSILKGEFFEIQSKASWYVQLMAKVEALLGGMKPRRGEFFKPLDAHMMDSKTLRLRQEYLQRLLKSFYYEENVNKGNMYGNEESVSEFLSFLYRGAINYARFARRSGLLDPQKENIIRFFKTFLDSKVFTIESFKEAVFSLGQTEGDDDIIRFLLSLSNRLRDSIGAFRFAVNLPVTGENVGGNCKVINTAENNVRTFFGLWAIMQLIFGDAEEAAKTFVQEPIEEAAENDVELETPSFSDLIKEWKEVGDVGDDFPETFDELLEVVNPFVTPGIEGKDLDPRLWSLNGEQDLRRLVKDSFFTAIKDNNLPGTIKKAMNIVENEMSLREHLKDSGQKMDELVQALDDYFFFLVSKERQGNSVEELGEVIEFLRGKKELDVNSNSLYVRDEDSSLGALLKFLGKSHSYYLQRPSPETDIVSFIAASSVGALVELRMTLTSLSKSNKSHADKVYAAYLRKALLWRVATSWRKDESLLVEPDVYNSQSFTSVQFRNGIAPKKDADVLVLGTGDGSDLIKAAERGAKSVVGTDISAKAVKTAQEKAQRSAYNDQIEVVEADLFNLPEKFTGRKFDHIYMHMPSAFERSNTLDPFDSEMTLLRRLLTEAHSFLKDGGTLEVSCMEEPNFLKAVYELGWEPAMVKGYDFSRQQRKDTVLDYVYFVLVPQKPVKENRGNYYFEQFVDDYDALIELFEFLQTDEITFWKPSDAWKITVMAPLAEITERRNDLNLVLYEELFKSMGESLKEDIPGGKLVWEYGEDAIYGDGAMFARELFNQLQEMEILIDSGESVDANRIVDRLSSINKEIQRLRSEYRRYPQMMFDISELEKRVWPLISKLKLILKQAEAQSREMDVKKDKNKIWMMKIIPHETSLGLFKDFLHSGRRNVGLFALGWRGENVTPVKFPHKNMVYVPLLDGAYFKIKMAGNTLDITVKAESEESRDDILEKIIFTLNLNDSLFDIWERKILDTAMVGKADPDIAATVERWQEKGMKGITFPYWHIKRLVTTGERIALDVFNSEFFEIDGLPEKVELFLNILSREQSDLASQYSNWRLSRVIDVRRFNAILRYLFMEETRGMSSLELGKYFLKVLQSYADFNQTEKRELYYVWEPNGLVADLLPMLTFDDPLGDLKWLLRESNDGDLIADLLKVNVRISEFVQNKGGMNKLINPPQYIYGGSKELAQKKTQAFKERFKYEIMVWFSTWVVMQRISVVDTSMMGQEIEKKLFEFNQGNIHVKIAVLRELNALDANDVSNEIKGKILQAVFPFWSYFLSIKESDSDEILDGPKLELPSSREFEEDWDSWSLISFHASEQLSLTYRKFLDISTFETVVKMLEKEDGKNATLKNKATLLSNLNNRAKETGIISMLYEMNPDLFSRLDAVVNKVVAALEEFNRVDGFYSDPLLTYGQSPLKPTVHEYEQAVAIRNAIEFKKDPEKQIDPVLAISQLRGILDQRLNVLAGQSAFLNVQALQVPGAIPDPLQKNLLLTINLPEVFQHGELVQLEGLFRRANFNPAISFAPDVLKGVKHKKILKVAEKLAESIYKLIESHRKKWDEFRSTSHAINEDVFLVEREMRANDIGQTKVTVNKSVKFIIDVSAPADIKQITIMRDTAMVGDGRNVYNSQSFTSVQFRNGIAPKKDAEVLILGTGDGSDLITAAERGAKSVIGTDINSKAVEVAQQKAQASAHKDKIEVVEADLFDLPEHLKGRKFDHIYINPPSAYEKTEDPAVQDKYMRLLKKLLKEAHGWLKEGGTLELAYLEEPSFLKAVYDFGWEPAMVSGYTYSREQIGRIQRLDYVNFTLVSQSRFKDKRPDNYFKELAEDWVTLIELFDFLRKRVSSNLRPSVELQTKIVVPFKKHEQEDAQEINSELWRKMFFLLWNDERIPLQDDYLIWRYGEGAIYDESDALMLGVERASDSLEDRALIIKKDDDESQLLRWKISAKISDATFKNLQDSIVNELGAVFYDMEKFLAASPNAESLSVLVVLDDDTTFSAMLENQSLVVEVSAFDVEGRINIFNELLRVLNIPADWSDWEEVDSSMLGNADLRRIDEIENLLSEQTSIDVLFSQLNELGNFATRVEAMTVDLGSKQHLQGDLLALSRRIFFVSTKIKERLQELDSKFTDSWIEKWLGGWRTWTATFTPKEDGAHEIDLFNEMKGGGEVFSKFPWKDDKPKVKLKDEGKAIEVNVEDGSNLVLTLENGTFNLTVNTGSEKRRDELLDKISFMLPPSIENWGTWKKEQDFSMMVTLEMIFDASSRVNEIIGKIKKTVIHKDLRVFYDELLLMQENLNNFKLGCVNNKDLFQRILIVSADVEKAKRLVVARGDFLDKVSYDTWQTTCSLKKQTMDVLRRIIQDSKNPFINFLWRIEDITVLIKSIEGEIHVMSSYDRTRFIIKLKDEDELDLIINSSADRRDDIFKKIKATLSLNKVHWSPWEKERDFAVMGTPGGIDLRKTMAGLQIKRDEYGIPLPVAQQPIEHMRIDGFTPVIVNVYPLENLPVLLGLN